MYKFSIYLNRWACDMFSFVEYIVKQKKWDKRFELEWEGFEF